MAELDGFSEDMIEAVKPGSMEILWKIESLFFCSAVSNAALV